MNHSYVFPLKDSEEDGFKCRVCHKEIPSMSVMVYDEYLLKEGAVRILLDVPEKEAMTIKYARALLEVLEDAILLAEEQEV